MASEQKYYEEDLSGIKALPQISKQELRELINNKEHTTTNDELGVSYTYIHDRICYVRNINTRSPLLSPIKIQKKNNRDEYFEVICPHCNFQSQIMLNQMFHFHYILLVLTI